jgi:hypothetical protein
MGGMGFGGMHAARKAVWNPGLVPDPDCIAIYNFEASGPRKDKKNLNDLDFYRRVQLGADVHHGNGSSQFNSGQNGYLGFTDAQLPADFPGKSGTENKTFSFAFWFMPHFAGVNILFAKWNGWDGKQVYRLKIHGDNWKPLLSIGWIGGSEDTPVLDRAVVAGQWYWIGVTHDGATREWRMRMYDQTAGDTVELTGTFTNGIALRDSAFRIAKDDDPLFDNDGDFTYDYFCAFKDVLTAAEIDDIRTGAKDPAADANCVALWDFEFDDFYGDTSGHNLDFAVPEPDLSNTKKQGGKSVDLEETNQRDCFAREDSHLTAGFPFKGGTTQRIISVTGWFRAETLHGGEYNYLWAKGAPGALSGHQVRVTNWEFTFSLYMTGSPNVAFTYAGGLSAGQWYFFAVTYDPAVHKQRIYLWDDLAKVVTYSGLSDDRSASEPALVNASPFRIGSTDYMGEGSWDGLLDEITVWGGRALSVADIELIRDGKYKFP